MLAAGMAAQGAVSAVQLGLPAIAPQLRDRFGLSLTGVGLVLASSTLGITLTLLAWGALADRVGERRVITAGLLGASIALALAARADGAVAFALALGAAGMLGSSANAASGRAVVGWFDARRRGLALGLRHMSTPAGGAVAAALLPVAVAAGGVDAAMLWLSAACALGALAGLIGLRPPPPGAGADAPVAPGPPTLRDRAIWRLSLGTAATVLAQIALLSFLVLYLHEERGLSTGAAALVLALVQAGGAVGRVAAGAWSDRAGRRVGPLRRIALAAAVTLAVATACLPAPDAVAVPLLVLAGVLAMSGNGVSFAAVAERAGAGRAGTALGLQNTVLAVAVTAAPPLFGAAVGALSWPGAFAAAAACPLAGWWLLRGLDRAERARGATPAPPPPPGSPAPRPAR